MHSRIRWAVIGLVIIVSLGIYSGLAVVTPAEPKLAQRQPTLSQVVEQAMADAQGRYGIVIKNFTTGENYYRNEYQIFEPGSLYKLWVMAVTFRQIKEGKLTENQQLAQKVEVLNSKFGIPKDQAELTEGVIEMTVAQALSQMIIISHNYAALLLSEKLKNSTIGQFLKEEGFNNSSFSNNNDPPKTTPSDIAQFFEKLYKRQLVDELASGQMIDLLKAQQHRDGLPKYLPESITTAHKTGDIGWFKHDGGIIFAPAGDILLVVLSESSYPPGAQERIAQLAQAVLDYFSK